MPSPFLGALAQCRDGPQQRNFDVQDVCCCRVSAVLSCTYLAQVNPVPHNRRDGRASHGGGRGLNGREQCAGGSRNRRQVCGACLEKSG